MLASQIYAKANQNSTLSPRNSADLKQIEMFCNNILFTTK